MKVLNLETMISVGLISTVLYMGGALFTCSAHATEFTQDIKVLCVQLNKASKAHDYILESKLISRIEGLTEQDVSKVCGE